MVRSGNSISQKQVADLQFVLFLFLSWQNHWNKFLLSYNVLNRYRKEFNRKKEGFGVLYCCVGCQWKRRTGLSKIYYWLLYWEKYLSIGWTLSEPGKLFWTDTENCAGCSASCTARSVRTECSRTSPLLIFGMWCHLVQWPWFFASCFQIAGWVFFYGTCGRAEDKRRFFCLAETQ